MCYVRADRYVDDDILDNDVVAFPLIMSWCNIYEKEGNIITIQVIIVKTSTACLLLGLACGWFVGYLGFLSGFLISQIDVGSWQFHQMLDVRRE
jgi:hypothetical protein